MLSKNIREPARSADLYIPALERTVRRRPQRSIFKIYPFEYQQENIFYNTSYIYIVYAVNGSMHYQLEIILKNAIKLI